MILIPLKPKYAKIRAEMIKKYGAKKGEDVFHAWVNRQNVNPEQKAYFFTTMQFKAIDDEFVEGDFAVGTPDAYKDILTEDCLKDMETQLKSLPITIDDNHESFKNLDGTSHFRATNPIAKIISAELKGYRLRVKAVLNKAHQRYVEIKSSIKEGFLHSFSFAFFPVGEPAFKNIDGVRHRIVDKLKILNGCFTGIPVNDASQFENVALKSLNDSEYDESEINSLIGGIFMTDEDKNKEGQEGKPKDQEKPEGGTAPEGNEGGKDNGGTNGNGETEEPKENVQVKALTEQVASLNKGMVELKGLLTKGEENKGIEEKLAEMKSKLEEVDKVLSSPQFKAKVNQKSMGQALNETGASEAKEPLDYM